MELMKKLIPETVTYESATGLLRLKPLSLYQYLKCHELMDALKDYLQTRNRNTLREILFLIDTVKDDIISENSLPPALIRNMDITEFTNLLNHLLPYSCRSKSPSDNSSGRHLNTAYAAGKIMANFPHYGIDELLNMSALRFFALYELAVKMQADSALEINYAAAEALHSANITKRLSRRGSRFHETDAPNCGFKSEEFLAVRKLAEELTSKDKKENL